LERNEILQREGESSGGESLKLLSIAGFLGQMVCRRAANYIMPTVALFSDSFCCDIVVITDILVISSIPIGKGIMPCG
jgi:hypothetical protein